ncbi:MAG: ABC transporter permease [Synergistaceae bacterium]|jgi:peptide/nickel transport system permease protein|nr:ABC transporter permease [Synergistaceae bacterium]
MNSHRKKLLRVAPFFVVFFIYVFAALVPGTFSGKSPTLTNLGQRLQAPGYVAREGEVYRLGTDELGRDIWSRLVYGARVSMSVSFASVLLSATIGGMLGVVAGYFQNVSGTLIMRIADVFLSIPFFLLAILTVAALGPNLVNLIVVLGVARWPRYARVAHGKTLTTANQDFIKAIVVLGAGPGRILLRHVLPEIVPSLIALATVEVGRMIIFEASLSFIGLGIQPPEPSWGSMLTQGQYYLSQAWWLSAFPCLAIFFLALSVNFIGDFARDALDPKIE